MGKTIKSICMVLLTAFIIFISSIPVSNAATSQLIIPISPRGPNGRRGVM